MSYVSRATSLDGGKHGAQIDDGSVRTGRDRPGSADGGVGSRRRYVFTAGSGTVLLTGTIDLSSGTGPAANTIVNGVLIATVASLTFAAGDRVSIKIAGTMTALAGAIVSIGLAPC